MKGMRNIAPLGVRIPSELKDRIAEEAQQNDRSMNSEIVQRLEMSFLDDAPPANEMLSAADARRIADQARDKLANTILKRTFEEISKMIRLGRKEIWIPISDLQLDKLSDNDFELAFQPTLTRLDELGYKTNKNDTSLFGTEMFLVIIP